MESTRPTVMVGNAKRMRNPSMPRGFTLLEMFVVVAIIAIILSVILVNQSSFNRNNLLTDTAYSVALSVRQTQSIGLSGRAINTTSKNTGYGIHVETAGASPITTYTQFADIYPDVVTISLMPGSQLPTGLNQIGTVCTGHTVLTPSSPEARPGDCLYSSGYSELVQTYRFQQGYTIGGFCGYQGSGCVPGGNAYCSGATDISGCGETVIPTSAIDTVFEKPNLQTLMVGTYGGSSYVGFDTVCIEIDAPKSSGVGKRYVKISKFGQVSVNTACVP